MVTEALNRMFIRARECDLFTGLKVGMGDHAEESTDLFFAKDALLFRELEMRDMLNIRCVLMSSQAVLGLNINLVKSEVVRLGSLRDLEDLAKALGCSMVNLGLPLGANFKEVGMWELAVDRFKQRLTGWNRALLSNEGDSGSSRVL